MCNQNGKYAVVTGAAKGLGYAIAKRLLEDGVSGLAILDFDITLAEKTAANLGPNVFAIKCDVSDKDEVAAAFKIVYEKMPRVDILVNNAGITRDASLVKMTSDQWEQVISVDLNSAFYCTKQVIANMKEQKYGKIINVASAAAFGNPGQSNYSAAKAGLIGFTRTISKEYAKYGITANSISPGLINTDIIKTIPEEILTKMVDAVPARRLGEPEEVASVVSFLASTDSNFANGNNIMISGGMPF
jgi:NAD(P)-dependent dehydrogenase (short-subunit alcohol dehydrogenase family)